MKGAPPPLRFLALVVGGWVAMRAAVLAPDWWTAPLGAAPIPVEKAASTRPAPSPPAPPAAPEPRPPLPRQPVLRLGAPQEERALLPAAPIESALAFASAHSGPVTDRGGVAPTPLSAPLRPPPRRAARWSGSAWLLARHGGGAAPLGPGGTLGGSQAGARLVYQVTPRLAFSGRLYAPLGEHRAAEVAAGLEWQPLPALPARLLVERRQALAGAGRSAFAAIVHGGVGDQQLPGGLKLDAYAQAGVVGLAARDLFADAVMRVGLPVGAVEVGGSVFGAAQPGAARVDIGPHVAVRLPVEGRRLRLIADWRFRVAGDARPGSGPALVLATDF